MEQMTIEQFSEKLSSKDPTPSGGSCTALIGSLSASLAQMVTNLTIGKTKYVQYKEELIRTKEKCEALRLELLKEIDKDIEVFNRLSLVYKKPIENDNDIYYLDLSLTEAAEAPLNVMELVCQIIIICERLADIGCKIAISDVAVACSCAQGCLQSCYANVIINTRLMSDVASATSLEKKAKSMLDKYSDIASNVYIKVIDRIKNG